MTTFQICNKFLVSVLFLSATAATYSQESRAPTTPTNQSAAPFKSCVDELREQGIKSPGKAFEVALIACRNRRNAEARSGAMGVESQVAVLCREEIKSRGYTAGIGAFQEEMNKCVKIRRDEAGAGGIELEEMRRPFGRGEVQDYLNSIHNGDNAHWVQVEREFGRRLGIAGGESLLLTVVARTYLTEYQKIYASCIEPSARTVSAGYITFETGRDRFGNHTERRSDRTFEVRVNERFTPIATRVHLDRHDPMINVWMRLGKISLGELNLNNVYYVVTNEIMSKISCDSAAIRQFESNLIRRFR